MNKDFRILVINPLVDGTHIALFENNHCLFEKLLPLENIIINTDLLSQVNNRKSIIVDTILSIGIDIISVNAICGRGGLLQPIEGGTYLINQKMVDDLREEKNGKHVSNLGALLANAIAEDWNVDAYIVDPVVVDEMLDIAKKTGIPSIERKSIFHALNQKAVGRSLAASLNANYHDLCLVIAHMGGGLTVGAHQYGRVIDVNNGFDGDGPLSFERAGSLPNKDLIELCFNGCKSKEQLQTETIYQSGIKAYLNIERRVELDLLWRTKSDEVKKVFDIVGYQVAKEIGKMSTVLSGNVNAIAITGDLATYDYLNQQIIQQVSWIADTYVFPGENVMLALAQGTLRVLQGMEEVKFYE